MKQIHRNVYFTDEKIQKMYYKSEVGRFKEWGTVNKGNSKIGYVEGDTYKEKVMKIEDVLTKEDEKIFFGSAKQARNAENMDTPGTVYNNDG